MRRALESLFRLMDSTCPAEVSAEELDGPHGLMLRMFHRMSFLASEPCMNPVPSCPDCFSGTPYLLGDQYVCNHCRSNVDKRHLQLWRFDLESLLRWFAREQGLRGGIARIDDGLWRLGALDDGPHHIRECFFLRGEACSDMARRRLAAFSSVLILHGRSEPPQIQVIGARMLAITEALTIEGGRLVVRPLPACLGSRQNGVARFDRSTGVLSLGDDPLGRIPPGTREFAFVDRLSSALGEVVAYADLKRAVCRATGSIDSRDEATFCHRLKSRLKKDHGIAAIDRLIQADRALGGYRLLREAVPSEVGGESWEQRRIVGGTDGSSGC